MVGTIRKIKENGRMAVCWKLGDKHPSLGQGTKKTKGLKDLNVERNWPCNARGSAFQGGQNSMCQGPGRWQV